MGADEIKFTDKRVDESWKERVLDEKVKTAPKNPSHESQPSSRGATSQKTIPIFTQLITSLAMQALIQLGEIENPASGTKMQDLEGAKETIDILLALKTKTQNNLSKEEEKLMESALGDLQMKFVQLSGL